MSCHHLLLLSSSSLFILLKEDRLVSSDTTCPFGLLSHTFLKQMHGFPGAVLMSPQLPEERGHIWTEHVKQVKSWGGHLHPKASALSSMSPLYSCLEALPSPSCELKRWLIKLLPVCFVLLFLIINYRAFRENSENIKLKVRHGTSPTHNHG